MSATAVTAFACPVYDRTQVVVATSHSFACMSLLAVTRYDESAENTQSHTHREWPASVVCSVPSRVFHSFTVLSEDAVARLRASGEMRHAVM